MFDEENQLNPSEAYVIISSVTMFFICVYRFNSQHNSKVKKIIHEYYTLIVINAMTRSKLFNNMEYYIIFLFVKGAVKLIVKCFRK